MNVYLKKTFNTPIFDLLRFPAINNIYMCCLKIKIVLEF